jgi:hypothetical protein
MSRFIRPYYAVRLMVFAADKPVDAEPWYSVFLSPQIDMWLAYRSTQTAVPAKIEDVVSREQADRFDAVSFKAFIQKSVCLACQKFRYKSLR